MVGDSGPSADPVQRLLRVHPSGAANYEMTAAYAFHGFYVLKADERRLTHNEASVKINVWKLWRPERDPMRS